MRDNNVVIYAKDRETKLFYNSPEQMTVKWVPHNSTLLYSNPKPTPLHSTSDLLSPSITKSYINSLVIQNTSPDIQTLHNPIDIPNHVLLEVAELIHNKLSTTVASTFIESEVINNLYNINTFKKKKIDVIDPPNQPAQAYTNKLAVALKQPLRSFYRLRKPFTL